MRDGWLRLTLGGQPTQLTYALTPAALPTATGGLPAGWLTITAYNATSAAVTCDSITITVPTGTDPGALTASPGLIQPVSAQPASWTFQAGSQNQQPGTFIATPVTAGSAVAQGIPLSFTLASLAVAQNPGLSALQVTEVTAAGQATLRSQSNALSPARAPAGNS